MGLQSSSSQGATDRQEEHWAQAAALSACLTLQLYSSSHPPRILRALPEDQLHTLATRVTGQRACAAVSPSTHMPDPGGCAPSGPRGAASQAKTRFSGSKALGSLRPLSAIPVAQGLRQACHLHSAWRSKTNLPSTSHRPGPSGLRPQQSESQPGPITTSGTN